MGLLDGMDFNNPQTQGLLAAASQMLQQSGPSRMPTGLGQILGGGLGAFNSGMQAAQQRKLEQDQIQQMAQLRGLQIQEAQGGLQEHERARKQAEALRQAYIDINSPTAQAQKILGADMPPTIDNAAKLSAAGQGAGPAGAAPQGSAGGIFEQRMALAQQLRARGFHDQADAQEAAALKFKPKFDNSPHVVMGADGKPTLVQTADDGTVRPIQGGYGVAEKLAFHNLGGRTVGVDPFTGAETADFKNTQSPDSVASNVVAMRGQNLTNQRAIDAQNTPQFNQEAGGFVSRPTAAAPGGTFTPLADYQKRDKPLTESQGKASLFASRMDKANRIMGELAASGTDKPSVIKNTLESVPLIGGALGRAGNFVASEPQQRLEQSQRDFVNAVLRQESGAAISPSEFESAQKQYFPQPGDSEGVIAQKAGNRATAIQGMALQSGPGAAKLGVGGRPGASTPGNFSIAAPNGKTYNFSNAKDLANFKLSAGIK